jgi:hypothetical protein
MSTWQWIAVTALIIVGIIGYWIGRLVLAIDKFINEYFKKD